MVQKEFGVLQQELGVLGKAIACMIETAFAEFLCLQVLERLAQTFEDVFGKLLERSGFEEAENLLVMGLLAAIRRAGEALHQ